MRPRFPRGAFVGASRLLFSVVTLGAMPPAGAAVLASGPLVQFIDTQERDDHADISVQFACSVRYVNNVPASHGSHTTITLRLGPDCGALLGTMMPELPVVGGGGTLVTGARLDSAVPGEITLELSFGKALDYVIAPSASGVGLKVRLLGIKPHRANGFVAEPVTPVGCAVNLDSSLAPFPHEAIEAAAAALKTQAYVSEADVEEQHWYRLRVGPFASRQEGERVLGAALAQYPRAWLAADDEATDLSLVERAGVESPPPARVTDPPLADDERSRILHDARSALEQHRYGEAIDALNRLLRQPDHPNRAEAQELMGLARERGGQLAQAKAEYQEYLRRYPDGAAAARVRARLQALASASLAAKPMGDYGVSQDERWTLAGSGALSYQYGKDETITNGTATTTNSLNSALLYGDLLLRDHGPRYDFTGRVDAGYTQNIVSTNGGSQDRTSAAYVEFTDKLYGATARVGRQSLASQGIVGLFDGVFAGYHVNPAWVVSAAAGLPAYTGYSAVSGREKFGTLTAEFDPWHETWVFDAYVYDQIAGHFTERRSIGLQTRHTVPGRTLVMLADYDLVFRQFNSLTLIGNARVGENWTLGFDADHRRSPQLQVSNALIGQTVQDLPSLTAALRLSSSQLVQLALARTPVSDTLGISATRAIGERWQFSADLAAVDLGGTPAAGGVAAIPSTGVEKSATMQVSGASLLQAGDLHIVSARVDDSPEYRTATLSWDARFVVRGAWRLGPRLSVEERNDPSLGGRQLLFLPQLRGDWTGRRSVFEVTAGYQLQNQQTSQQTATLAGQAVTTVVDQRSLYVSGAYRVRF